MKLCARSSAIIILSAFGPILRASITVVDAFSPPRLRPSSRKGIVSSSKYWTVNELKTNLTGSTSSLSLKVPGTNSSPTESEIDLADVLQKCAIDRSAKASDVIETLEKLERSLTSKPLGSTSIYLKEVDLSTALDGTFELIFSSAVANLPILGNLCGGYMPNKELITFDLEKKQMSLVVELLPFLPSIDIYGESLALDEDGATLNYVVQGKEQKPPSQWKILYSDVSGEIIAARSSVTGLNVIRRVV